MAEKIEIELMKSVISCKPNQVATVRCLGLRKVNSVVIQDASPAILGMVRTVSHLVEVRPYKGKEKK
ncbi:MAG: 50S ribosomal protein L30 [Spirochaetes bacterium GWD1_61_31]|nr:MAG: 50S ribosomal protein L30 [Spirochaetes bacterium GWB1_60_80]OHD29953.1 MAG: 50S ribosomal protein L30 [Spirochaetes bacterium GWC1_61_12]OHD43836.1 MAG: 50S ribosomal protein L30 [Spirochaetes bacterium GWD1_61_31]OHD46079.1 MAG: 50S ribosomal protein L30 [Spirochaetes bacterium GWE1_60_18]OHD60651.1 MAG: 50S ribosomal protein L30 [Spirochaetes bacterium GWF1_60_12]HAP43422.1 50S ribosomal protein L30 [Spirochaetaceae bacterium]